MNMLDIKRLKNSLIEAPLPENKAIKYLLFWIFLWSSTRLFPHVQMLQDVGQIIIDIAVVPISLIGTYHCFKKNGGSDGVFFLQRFFSISLVITGRVVLMFFLPIFIAIIIIENLIGQIPSTTTWYHVVLSTGVLIIIFWRISIHISEVAERTEHSSIGSMSS